MKTILVFVSTLDGKITKWGYPDVRIWSSREDQQYFSDLWNLNHLIVMGSNTYNANPVKVASNQLIVVMTSQPSKYDAIPGQLEFSNLTPSQLIKRFEMEGYEQMMVVGGAHLATSFLKEQLIDEIWLTIEPKILGAGGNIVINEKLEIDLRLLSFEKVNDQGTLITKYGVNK